jgi:hypothetical protein
MTALESNFQSSRYDPVKPAQINLTELPTGRAIKA